MLAWSVVVETTGGFRAKSENPPRFPAALFPLPLRTKYLGARTLYVMHHTLRRPPSEVLAPDPEYGTATTPQERQ